MSNQIFGKITTNRYTLMKYIKEFECRKTGSESLIAPRPMRGKKQSSYYAMLNIQKSSENYLFFTKLKKFEYIDKDEYQKQMQGIKHSWRV